MLARSTWDKYVAWTSTRPRDFPKASALLSLKMRNHWIVSVCLSLHWIKGNDFIKTMEEENDRKDSDKLEKELKTHGFAATWPRDWRCFQVCVSLGSHMHGTYLKRSFSLIVKGT